MPSLRHNIKLGKQAEAKAASYVGTKGFTVKAQNYRFQRGEIDIIAEKKNLLIFVEIKARTSNKFGYPENFVHAKQKYLYQTAASHYIETHGWQGDVRFDIIALQKVGNGLCLAHFEDAFY